MVICDEHDEVGMEGGSGGEESRIESLASPTSTGRGSVGEEPQPRGEEFVGALVPRPSPGVFACALKSDS